MADDCKRSFEFTVPVEEVEAETAKVLTDIQKKAKLPGFRPGKVPLSILRSRFASDVRQSVLEAIGPRHFKERAERDNLPVVGNPSITDVHFHEGEPLRFKIEFEVAPAFDLGEYRGLTVTYNPPVVSDEDVEKRLDTLRNEKGEFVNVDPRPLESGDYAVVALHSIKGVEGEPVSSDEMVLHIGDADTMPEFTENMTGMSPGEEKEFSVHYSDEYGNTRLAGRDITFHVALKGIRRKELPELNDEFAADLGDYKSLMELREEIRRQIFREREHLAQTEAKSRLVSQLVESHDFPVPEAYLNRQIQTNVESRFQELAQQGIDPRKLNIDWEKLRIAQIEPATRDVKASLILEKIAEREAIETLSDEVDREVQRHAKNLREPVAAVRMKFEKDGTLRRIASRIRTEKVLNFLFEQARKVAGEVEPEPEESASE